MSDQDLRTSRPLLAALLLLVLAAGCGNGEAEREPPAGAARGPEAGPPLEIRPLSDAELMGIDRTQIVLNLPWSGNVLAKEPAPAAARATLRSVDIARGETFDRITFTFGTDAPLPGYRIAWNDERTASCDDEAIELPAEWTLLVGFEPATARDDAGRATVAERARRPALPAIREAEQICDQTNRLTWALAAADSGLVRLAELRAPPRLAVDVMHPASAGGAPAP